jgi:predicted chitinase
MVTSYSTPWVFRLNSSLFLAFLANKLNQTYGFYMRVKITANQATFLKKSTLQASKISEADKELVPQGKSFDVDEVLERIAGHCKIKLAWGQGIRFVFESHFDGWKRSILVPIASRDRTLIITAIKEQCKNLGITYKPQIAYILATAEHESDNFRAFEEYASGTAYEGRSDLGNTQRGDGIKYKGRGLVQITGRINYAKFTKILKAYGENVDLVNNPELAERPDIAVFTLVYGMLKGFFTGWMLADFIEASAVDFVNARKIVNGLDRADHIAAIAREWLKYL